MEKTTNTTNQQLSTAELLEAIEKDPTKVGPSIVKRSAIEAIKAVAAIAGIVAAHAEHLLAVLPQVLELLAISEKIEPELLEGPSEIKGLTWSQLLGKFRAGLIKLLDNSSFAIRRAAHLALLRFKLNPALAEQDATDALVWAVQQKYLSPTFQVTAEGFGFQPEDKAEILRLVGALRGKQLAAVEIRQAEKLVAVIPPKPRTSKSEISTAMAWQGELGHFELTIPPNGDKGGVLKLESILNATDKIEFAVEKASNGYADLETSFIVLDAIRDKEGKVRENLGLLPEPDLGDKNSQIRQERKIRLGNLLKRGFSKVLAEESRELEPQEFLEGCVGKSTLTFEGNFNWDPPGHPEKKVTISNLTLRFARRSDGMIALVGIRSKEEEAVELFGDALGMFSEPGKAFVGVQFLQCKVFLRAVFGQVVLNKAYGE